MHSRRLSFVGVKTERFDVMAAFARDVLGLTPGHQDDGWAVFQLESGDRDLLEVYGLQQDHAPPASTDRGNT